MLSSAKHLLAGYTLYIVIARLGTSRGNLTQYVMLSSAKHLLAGYTLSTQSLVGFEEILRYTQNDNTSHYY